MRSTAGRPKDHLSAAIRVETPSALTEIKLYEYAVRFVFGGLIHSGRRPAPFMKYMSMRNPDPGGLSATRRQNCKRPKACFPLASNERKNRIASGQLEAPFNHVRSWRTTAMWL